MDWNHDGKINGSDYIHYQATGGESSSANTGFNSDSFAKVIVVIIVLALIMLLGKS